MINHAFISFSAVQIFNKEIKNTSECIVEYISTWEFLRTREKCIEKSLYNSTMHEDEVFYFFIKC